MNKNDLKRKELYRFKRKKNELILFIERFKINKNI
jgi:hypothetical protein